jgi:hypothetical protein
MISRRSGFAICYDDVYYSVENDAWISIHDATLFDTREDLRATITRDDASDTKLLRHSKIVFVSFMQMDVEDFLDEGESTRSERLNQAIDDLASMFPNGHLLASTDPAVLLSMAIEELDRSRTKVQSFKSQPDRQSR